MSMERPPRVAMKALLAEVRALLWARWDPLHLAGIAPVDEYDSYALVLVGMIWRGQSAGAIADYLDRACVEAMAVRPDRATHESLGRALLALHGGDDGQRSDAPRDL
jgi:hypothetical protein